MNTWNGVCAAEGDGSSGEGGQGGHCDDRLGGARRVYVIWQPCGGGQDQWHGHDLGNGGDIDSVPLLVDEWHIIGSAGLSVAVRCDGVGRQ